MWGCSKVKIDPNISDKNVVSELKKIKLIASSCIFVIVKVSFKKNKIKRNIWENSKRKKKSLSKLFQMQGFFHIKQNNNRKAIETGVSAIYKQPVLSIRYIF